ncbi:hypothetical protein CAC42_5720 [Sphaceloma murrayae]|uniref:ubiquitinyl hydrolase 1 n=1 Tax=Sphaceloma murrayae TaxID=2082308 RepID=A0A2K1QZ53_9PEZI|nr:hypothetical protein CAC42_5720 [Sphaceloma murrayae]
MSFFGKFKSNATPASPNLKDGPKEKLHTLLPSALDKHLADLTGPYSSTCYCNSILQCLFYSVPFRDHVINFPQLPQAIGSASPDEVERRMSTVSRTIRSPLTTKPPPSQPGPLAANSPARRPLIIAGTPQAQNQKPDEKDSPEWRKKMLMQTAQMLDMQLDYSDTYSMQESLFTALKDIFEAIISHPTRTGIVSPHKFLEILRKENEMFRSAMHQDAHEFLNLLLNQVVDTVELHSKRQLEGVTNGAPDGAMTGMNQPTALTKASTGWVHELFEGLLVSETRCLTCENTSQRDEAFMDLSVDLEAHSSVTSCLRKFSEEEMLCERNKFHCDNCGGLQEAEKRMKIKRLPRILALHLKRFKYTEDYNRLQKLFHRVVYPYHLRLFNTTDDAEDQDRLYELYAVVVHIGGGPYHGHYVSIIKTQDRGWLLFDDELVEPVTRDYVQHFFGGEPKPGVQDAKQLACAYVLFYQETTLEAVQKEQEAEAAAAAAAAAAQAQARNSDVQSPASPVQPSGLFANGFKGLNNTVTTPTEEKDEPFANLAHAATAPAVPTAAANTPGSPLVNSGSLPSLEKQKTKKDLKKEFKAAEKERKAAEKEAEKMARVKAKEAMEARRERVRKAEEELQAAIEASKATKAEEDAKGGATASAGDKAEEPRLTHSVTMGELGNGAGNGNVGIGSRFRHGSMSISKKKGFWGVGKKEEKAEGNGEVKEGEREEGSGNGNGSGSGIGKEGQHVVREMPSSPSLGLGLWKRGSDAKEKEEGNKKNRFSMGRKKSAVFGV